MTINDSQPGSFDRTRMLSYSELSRALDGALHLLRGSKAGLDRLDTSLEGFWRSFLWIVPAAPVYFMYMLAERRIVLSERLALPEMFDEARFVTAKVVELGLEWVAFPILVALLARPLAFERRYVPYVVAYNWSSAVAALLLTPPIVLYGLDVIGREGLAISTMLLLGVVLRYRYVVARIALGVDGMVAVGLVAMDLVLGLLVSQAATALAGI